MPYRNSSQSRQSKTFRSGRSGSGGGILKDILAVTDACRDGSAVSKVIIETALLTDDEKVRVCRLARRARADFVKTSTGFASGGATARKLVISTRCPIQDQKAVELARQFYRTLAGADEDAGSRFLRREVTEMLTPQIDTP